MTVDASGGQGIRVDRKNAAKCPLQFLLHNADTLITETMLKMQVHILLLRSLSKATLGFA